MEPDRVESLVAGYLDGTLAEPEAQELLALLERNPALQAELLRQRAVDRSLREAAKPPLAPDAVIRAVRSGRGGRLADRVLDRVRGGWARRTLHAIPALVMVAMLLASITLVFLQKPPAPPPSATPVPPPPPSFSQAAVPGLVAQWRLDETIVGASTQAADSTGNGRDGTHSNTPMVVAPPGNPGIAFGNPACLAFNGTDETVTVAGLESILGTTATLTAWIRTTQAATSANNWECPALTGVEVGGGSNDIFWGYIDNTGRIGLNAGNGPSAVSTNPINDDAWHHVALTRDSTTGQIQIFVDGVSPGPAPGEAGPKTTAFSSIGRIEGVTGTLGYFQGRLDDVRVYSRVLDAAEIQAIAAGTDAGVNPPAPPGPPPPPPPPPAPRTNDHDEGLLDDKCSCGAASPSVPFILALAILAFLALVRRSP